MKNVRQRRKIFAGAGLIAMLLGAFMTVAPLTAGAAAPSPIDPNDNCPSYAPGGTGKIDTTGDPETVTVHAPPGKLIDGYCVKAGQPKEGESTANGGRSGWTWSRRQQASRSIIRTRTRSATTRSTTSTRLGMCARVWLGCRRILRIVRR